MTLASLLPGLREIRTPLVAGYLWLAFAYLVAGAPASLDEAPGPLHDIVDLLQAFGSLATGIAVSFVAYLVGSLSDDLFGRFVPRLLQEVADEFAIRGHRPHLYALRGEVESGMRHVYSTFRDTQQTASDHNVAQLHAVALGLAQRLREAATAGASEGEKPEALRPMLEAERNLRLAIVPPLLALMIFLTVEDSAWWSFGLLFAAMLFIQAALREVEANQLAAQYGLAQEYQQIESHLSAAADQIAEGSTTMALNTLGKIDWGRFI